jgi:thiamine pyrophosphate-dependent acetolactate synthase large subunit-like protein
MAADTRARPTAGDTPTVAQTLIDVAATLSDVCARPPRWQGAHGADRDGSCAFFLISAASVYFVEAAVAHPRIRATDVSVETQGAFAAIEASIATGRLQVVIGGSGPGTMGLLPAIPGARSQSATVLVLTPRTPAALVGAYDIQESSYFHPLHAVGAELYDAFIPLGDAAEMPRLATRLRQLFARPQGAVVHVSVPTNVLAQACPQPPPLHAIEVALPAPSAATVRRIVELMDSCGGRTAFLLGNGCVPYRGPLAELVARCGAVHFSTPAAAGILSGSLGVIGNAGSGEIPRRLRELDVRCLIALGTRTGTASGGANAELLPDGCSVVHVDLDAGAVAGNALATRNRPGLAVTADLGEFIDALLQP